MLPMARIRVIATDSALTPKDNGSYSSRVSFMVGNAALRAAEELKRVLVAAAARRLEVAARRDRLGRASAARVVGTDKSLDFAQVVEAALVDSGTLTVKGAWSTPPETQGGKFRGAAVGSTAGFSYAAQVVEVSVDEDTGVVRVEHVWVAHDCGFAHQPAGRRRPGAGRRVDGHGPGAERGDAVPRGPAAARRTSSTTASRRSPSRRRSTSSWSRASTRSGPFGAKEASEGALHGFPPALTERHLRRHRHPPARAAGHARPRARSDPRAPARAAAAGAARGARRQRRARPPPPRRSDHGPHARIPARAPGHATPRRRRCSPPSRAPGCWPAAPTCVPNLRRGLEQPDAAGRPGRACTASTRHRVRRRRHCVLGAGVTLARLAADARIAQRLHGARRSRARRRRPRPPQRGHARRQPVPGHALRVLQPERMVARRPTAIA